MADGTTIEGSQGSRQPRPPDNIAGSLNHVEASRDEQGLPLALQCHWELTLGCPPRGPSPAKTKAE